MPSSPHARIPATDRVLNSAPVAALTAAHGRAVVADAVRAELAALRKRIDGADLSEAGIAARVAARVDAMLAPSLKPVFNLTGTVLHTNLGRAPLPEEAIQAIASVARGASTLEYDIDSGKRGERDHHVEGWLCRLTGAQAATVVNNNAAAVMLALNTLAARKEVAVSRGELIEIGGAFRLPEIMARSGCRLGITRRRRAPSSARSCARTRAITRSAASPRACRRKSSRRWPGRPRCRSSSISALEA
jgi:L-seryl-tRNA(Ser) seleniumtransferase